MRGRELLPYTERTSRSTVARNPDRRRGLPTTVRLGSHSGFDGSGGRKEVSRPSRQRTYEADVRQRALDSKVDLVTVRIGRPSLRVASRARDRQSASGSRHLGGWRPDGEASE